jgi:hypothetical protein
MAADERFVATTLSIGAGIVVWALHLLALYGVTALACARGLDDVRWLGFGIVPWTVVLATLIGVGVVAWIGTSAWRTHSRERLAPWLSATLCAVAAFAMLLEAIPVAIVSVCG